MAYFCYSGRSYGNPLDKPRFARFTHYRLFRSVSAGVCTLNSGSISLIVLGLVAFLLTFSLYRLTNYSTVSLSLKEVSMKRQIIIAFTMFTNSVAINLFSTELGVVQT